LRRCLGGHVKEEHWMEESFTVKHFIGDAEDEVLMLSSVAHTAYCLIASTMRRATSRR